MRTFFTRRNSPSLVRIPSRNDCSIFSSRSEEHTSELQSQSNLVCRLLLEKKKKNTRVPRTLHSHIVRPNVIHLLTKALSGLVHSPPLHSCDARSTQPVRTCPPLCSSNNLS